MFTGIIETLGEVVALKKELSNLHIQVKSSITSELKIDQSVAHNGVCLTVVAIDKDVYTVTAIEETLKKTNLSELQNGGKVNLERCMMMNGRLDGHIVQGHVDQVGVCLSVHETNGSWSYVFQFQPTREHLIVEKGSICINGISLTAFNVTENSFEVAIIPYTYEHTNLHQVKAGDKVNLEFDIIGKYVARLHSIK
jgi:riboflavin synthase